jgi:outer membrane protein TolC
MAQAVANIDVAKAQMKVAKSGYLPTLSLDAINGWASKDFPGAKNSNWTVELNANINLFDSGLTKSQVRQADDSITAAQEQAQQTHDNISLQIRQAYLSMKEAEKRIDTSNVAVNQAQENYRMANVRYAAGVGTNLDAVDAELDLVQAKTNYVQALYDYNTDKAQLEEAMGVPVK